ncbi:SLAM family member 6-like isoform X3 [Coregonus clupeaformis]|uniref:SLAM family member 6-like isoform X3 n=1 Tax=Coregonus clupeaformis TaxID=59861 RepID=UPI001BDF86E5|nr:SLAM family member 6-like isoform X3 [Coregonus clupeaformis]
MGSPPLPSSEMKHFLLIFCAASLAVILEPGSGEDDPVVLAVKGGSVQLDVQTSLEGMDIEYIFWRYNLTHSVVRYSNESKNPMKAYQDYENRVGMDPRSYTLELKNLQETDNGIYSAKITDHRGYEKDVARHVLAVHEAVPDVELRMLLLYLNSSEGFCNVSVTCSAHDSYASYTCDLSGCTEDEVVLYKPHLVMTVTGSDGTIMCNASNLVSKKSQWGRMGDVCKHRGAGLYKDVTLGTHPDRVRHHHTSSPHKSDLVLPPHTTQAHWRLQDCYTTENKICFNRVAARA